MTVPVGGEGSEPRPRFSVVIPAYNEEAFLPGLLATLAEAGERYRGGPGAIEIIVADNASTDRTVELATERGCRVVRVEKRVIAAVRNGGAKLASGTILCFVDADTRVHPETFVAIDEKLQTGKVVGGATGVRLERMSPGIAAAHVILIPMVWITGMDTGLVFCRRADFETIGGYSEDLPVAEDVRFLFDLRRLGRERGQRLARATAAKAVASARKWDEHGDWHYVWMILGFFMSFLFRSRWEGFVKRYWYGNQREPGTTFSRPEPERSRHAE